ncbi:MAG TPA: histidine kinase, partial [Thermoanaerobaculia bacterium]|nr:histidine kinase [Thermoanaerobaculia bacterium]
MNPILATSGHFRPYLLAWVPLTAITGTLLVLGARLTPLEAAFVTPPLTVVYAFLCLSSWYLCKAVPVGAATLARMAGTLLAAAALASTLWAAWGATIVWGLAAIPAFASLPDRLPALTPVVVILGFLLYLLAAAVHYVLLAVDRARAEEARGAELSRLAREAELRALKEQLNPHFLFNSLNSISALTTSSPEKAREMCVLLAGFLRATLGLSGRTTIPLGEELSLVRNYLEIEKARFGDRLRVEESVDAGAAACPVPPPLLQPLVEKAVKHGVAPRIEGGAVTLTARRADDTIRIELVNPFDPDAGPAPGAGVGL